MLGFADDSFCASTTSGTYKTTTGSATCTDCGAGKYSTAVGLETASCVSCSTGTYQAMQGSTFCHSCSWEWEGKTTSSSTTDSSACFCPKGSTGSGFGLFQDTASSRPSFLPASGPLGLGATVFQRESLHFLDAPPRNWKIQSKGGLAIVVGVKFDGNVGMHERIIDFGNAMERYYDSFLLSRWEKSSRLYAAITEKVSMSFA